MGRPGPAVTVSMPAATYDGCPGVQPAYRDKLARHLTDIDERIEQLLGLKASIEEILRSEPGSMRGRCCTGLPPSEASLGLEVGSSGESAR